MPREMRKILFDAAELETAALAHCRRHGIYVPEGVIGSISVGAGPAQAVSLRFGRDAQASELSLDRGQLGDALLDYCREAGIPMPRAAVKSVRAEGSCIAMTIEPQGPAH